MANYQFVINVASNSPQQLTGTVIDNPNNILFSSATFYGIKSFNQTGINNSGSLYFGSVSGRLANLLTPGDSINYVLPNNQRESLSNFWMQGTTGDGLYVVTY